MRLEEKIKSTLKQIHQWAIDCRNLQPGFSGKYKSDQDRVKCLKLLIHIYQQAEAALFDIKHARSYVKKEPALFSWVCKRCNACQPKGGEVWFDRDKKRYLCPKCVEELTDGALKDGD
jgi:predicted SprT family Zn-dependent metalloprotease